MTTPAQQFSQTLEHALGQEVFGVQRAIHGLAVALVADGHVLVEGVPGLGKTLLAKTLARLLGGRFKRIQCTADLMPSDITGVHVFDSAQGKFELMPGPVFADVLLVDEVNRTGPKTQSALLEAMEERSVTIDRKTYRLPADFFVIASQNPHEFEGTYPLPESQLDRFLLRLKLSYPAAADEQRILRAYDRPGGGHVERAAETASLSRDLLKEARAQAANLHVSDAVYSYVGAIADASRQHPQVSLGLSTRGALGLMRCARAEAALRGGEFVTPDDVKTVAEAVLAHRLILTPDASLDGIGAETVCANLLQQVAVPRE